MASAAKREGKPFDYTLMDFADSLTPETMAEWSTSIMQQRMGATETKRDYNGNDLMPKKEKFNPKIRKLCPAN